MVLLLGLPIRIRLLIRSPSVLRIALERTVPARPTTDGSESAKEQKRRRMRDQSSVNEESYRSLPLLFLSFLNRVPFCVDLSVSLRMLTENSMSSLSVRNKRVNFVDYDY